MSENLKTLDDCLSQYNQNNKLFVPKTVSRSESKAIVMSGIAKSWVCITEYYQKYK